MIEMFVNIMKIVHLINTVTVLIDVASIHAPTTFAETMRNVTPKNMNQNADAHLDLKEIHKLDATVQRVMLAFQIHVELMQPVKMITEIQFASVQRDSLEIRSNNAVRLFQFSL